MGSLKSTKSVLVLGGTRFFGTHLVNHLIEKGYDVTIATRGNTEDPFGLSVHRIRVDRHNFSDMQNVFGQKFYDVVYDQLAYCSDDIKASLENIRCSRYIMTSSVSVYELLPDIHETGFRPEDLKTIWGSRSDFTYDTGKQMAESALVNAYPQQDSAMVRFPFVIGEDDYTKRLFFYVEHIVTGRPMHIDNLHSHLGFISSDEAGRFLSFLLDSDIEGPVNGSCTGTVSLQEIISYVERISGKEAVISPSGDPAPFNEAPSYSLNTDKALAACFQFQSLRSCIFELLCVYFKECMERM